MVKSHQNFFIIIHFSAPSIGGGCMFVCVCFLSFNYRFLPQFPNGQVVFAVGFSFSFLFRFAMAAATAVAGWPRKTYMYIGCGDHTSDLFS